MSSRVLKDADNQITCKYNAVTHKGVDVVKYKGKTCPIIAHTSGYVTFIQTGQKNNTKATGNASYGNCVKLKHSNNYRTLYAHMSKVYVKKGQYVERGDEIGYMGNTGRSFGSHLHFEVRNTLDVRINPTPYLNADLPKMKRKYRTYDNVSNKWLPYVTSDTKEYAGNIDHGVSGVQIEDLEYRVHDKAKKKWLPWVKGTEDYAGNLNSDIDGIQIKGSKYRVHIKGAKWLGWVSKVDSTSSGYAGIYGKTIDAIQIK